MAKVKILYFLLVIAVFVILVVGNHTVFSQIQSNPESPFLPSPPPGKYPYTQKIFSIFQIDSQAYPNYISTVQILVTNNANFTIYDVNIGESFNDSENLKLYGLHKISTLEPNETKSISGELYVSPNVKPANYYDIWWDIVAKNETGQMMESLQFHRDLTVTEPVHKYQKVASPLQQYRQGVIYQNISCKQNFELVKKSKDESPACVQLGTMMALIKRGWAVNPLSDLPHTTTDQKYEILNQVMSYPAIKDWSDIGWRFNGYAGNIFLNGTSKYTFDVFLPTGWGDPKIGCNAGWHSWITMDGDTWKVIDAHYPNMVMPNCGEYYYPSDNYVSKQEQCNFSCKQEKETNGFACYPVVYGDYYCIPKKENISSVVIPDGAESPSAEPNNYIPDVIRVVIGVNNTVEWTNLGQTPSSVVENKGLFDSGPILNKPWSFRFDVLGVYKYHSEPHPWMHGKIIVSR